jgi:ribosomal protein S18 acetylase RimI-like enzyme
MHTLHVEFRRYKRSDLLGVIELCEAEGWPSFAEDGERAHRVLTAPGVRSVVAVEGDHVLGFAYLQSHGEIQAHLSLIAVTPSGRRQGIGRSLLDLAINDGGGVRIDLITDGAVEFYEALGADTHWRGVRVRPPFTIEDRARGVH